MSYFFLHLVSYKNKPLAAPFGPLTPGSIQRHATFLTRDRCLWAPSGGSEYHLEVCESADCLQTIRDLVIKLLWNSYFVKMWDASSRLVSVLFQHVLQVWMHLFRMCQKLPSIATRDLSQLPLLPTKVMRCEGWNCSWWNNVKVLENVGNTRITRTFSVKCMLKHVNAFISIFRGSSFNISILGSCGCSWTGGSPRAASHLLWYARCCRKGGDICVFGEDDDF